MIVSRQSRALFRRFLAVGGCGFVIDVICFQLMFEAGGGLVLSRIGSAAIAITATWYLNRHFVFETRNVNASASEYGRYLGVQLSGLAVNFGVYFTMLKVFPALRSIPVLALAAGAAVALIFNFLGAKWWAFRVQRLP